jgi:uncharacterized membrane protein
MDRWLVTLTLIGAIGAGLMAGLFFAFSVSVMPGLRLLSPADGIASMQSINRAILNPVFMVVFIGTTLACGALAVTTVWTWDDGGAGYRLAGGFSYVIGGFGLTAGYHVPRNDALDKLSPAGDTPRGGRRTLPNGCRGTTCARPPLSRRWSCSSLLAAPSTGVSSAHFDLAAGRRSGRGKCPK